MPASPRCIPFKLVHLSLSDCFLTHSAQCRPLLPSSRISVFEGGSLNLWYWPTKPRAVFSFFALQLLLLLPAFPHLHTFSIHTSLFFSVEYIQSSLSLLGFSSSCSWNTSYLCRYSRNSIYNYWIGVTPLETQVWTFYYCIFHRELIVHTHLYSRIKSVAAVASCVCGGGEWF